MSLADKMRNETAKKQESLRDEGRVEGRTETKQQILDSIDSGQTIEDIRQSLIDDLEQNG